MPARTLGSEGWWIVRSHIGWRRKEQVPVRTMGLEGGRGGGGVDCNISHWLERGQSNFL